MTGAVAAAHMSAARLGSDCSVEPSQWRHPSAFRARAAHKSIAADAAPAHAVAVHAAAVWAVRPPYITPHPSPSCRAQAHADCAAELALRRQALAVTGAVGDAARRLAGGALPASVALAPAVDAPATSVATRRAVERTRTVGARVPETARAGAMVWITACGDARAMAGAAVLTPSRRFEAFTCSATPAVLERASAHTTAAAAVSTPTIVDAASVS